MKLIIRHIEGLLQHLSKITVSGKIYIHDIC